MPIAKLLVDLLVHLLHLLRLKLLWSSIEAT
jgi:hypothetical protein